MEENQLKDEKLYSLGIDTKKDIKSAREDINKFYTSLSSLIVPVVPFAGKIVQTVSIPFTHYQINLLLLLISLIGIIATTSWVLSLKRLAKEGEAVDSFLVGLEKKYNVEFIIYLEKHLAFNNAPVRVINYEMVIPYTFLGLFCLVLIFALTAGAFNPNILNLK